MVLVVCVNVIPFSFGVLRFYLVRISLPESQEYNYYTSWQRNPRSPYNTKIEIGSLIICLHSHTSNGAPPGHVGRSDVIASATGVTLCILYILHGNYLMIARAC